MGNKKNKSPKRTFHQTAKQDLRESNKGSYYSTLLDDEVVSEEGESERMDIDVEDNDFMEGEVESLLTASERKLLVFPPVDYQEEVSEEEDVVEPEVAEEGNRIIDIALLSAAIAKATTCSTCNSGGLTLRENSKARKGWASKMYLFCSTCETKTTFSTSQYIDGNKRNSSVINRSLVLGMRSIGRGRKGAEVLSAHLRLPPPVYSNPWAEHTRLLDEAAGEGLEMGLKESTRRLKKTKIELGEVAGIDKHATVTDSELDELTVDCAASFDGSWKSRGFHSRHGFVSAISADTGEVLDCIYLTSLCKPCSKWTGKKNTPEYMDFMADHFPSCHLNHDGSAASMEVEGIKQLFERSEDAGLRYTTYVGDGDSRSFTTVKQLQPYGPDVMINKEECIGHIQKRMGTRLRSLIAKTKGQKLADGKGLQGAGRLTLARVNAFQRFYGLTLRTYAGQPEMASKSTMAMLQHYSEPPDHSLCPHGASSWCKFQQDAALGTATYIPPKQGLPEAVVHYIKPVFTSLSSVTLLSQTQRALTQNANESLHHLIWSLAPKEQYNSNAEVSLAVRLAVMRFNNGLSVTSKRMFGILGIPLIRSAEVSFLAQDNNRIKTATFAASDHHKQKRAEKNQAKFKDRGFVSRDYSSGAYHEGLKREPPKCTSCGKPRKGHPRGSCPES